MYDGLSDREKNTESDFDNIRKSLKGLTNNIPSKPENANGVSEAYVRGRLYGADNSADRPIRELSDKLYDFYGENMSGEDFHQAFQKLEEMEDNDRNIRGKDALELFRNYTENK